MDQRVRLSGAAGVFVVVTVVFGAGVGAGAGAAAAYYIIRSLSTGEERRAEPSEVTLAE